MGYSFSKAAFPELHSRETCRLPLQPFVGGLSVLAHLPSIQEHRRIFHQPWNQIVVTLDLFPKMGLEGQLQRPDLVSYVLDRSLDHSI